MNWDHLKVFLAVARQGTALGAAQLLQVNHSTVIRRIDQLEKQLGGKLFNRLQTGYQLTGDGHNVLAAAEQMEEGALLLERKIKGREEVSAGVLHVSRPENTLLDLSMLLCDFHQKYRQIQLQITSSAAISNLNRLEADIAIRLTDNPPELLIGREIGRVEFGVFAHRHYLQLLEQSLSRPPSETDCAWLMWQGNSSSQIPEAHHPDVLLMQQIPGVEVVLRSNSMDDILAGVKAGLGVGAIARASGLKEPELVELPFKPMLENIGFACVGLWLLTHRDMRQSARVRVFIDFMVEHWGNASL